MAFLTVWVRCHTNPSLGISQAVTSDIRRKRVRDHVKRQEQYREATACGI